MSRPSLLLALLAAAPAAAVGSEKRTLLGAHADYRAEVAPLAARIVAAAGAAAPHRGVTIRPRVLEGAPAAPRTSAAVRDVAVAVEGAVAGDALGLFCARAGYASAESWASPSRPLLLDYVPLFGAAAVGGARVEVAPGAAATVTTRLPHARCALEWRVIAADATLSAPVVQASAFNATFPYHARLAFGPHAQSEMWLSWSVDTNPTGAGGVPRVRLGVTPGVYTREVVASQPMTSYAASDMCGKHANETDIAKYLFPGYFANVLITGLAPGTRYYATYGSLDGGFATETTFTTAKALGPDVPVRLAAFGDMALSLWDGAMGTVAEVVRLHDATADGGLDAVLHFGDLGYAEGSTVIWEMWHSYIEPATRKIPYMVSQGNHEADHASQPCFQDPVGPDSLGPDGTSFHQNGEWGEDSDGEGGVATWARFRSPGVGVPGGTAPRGNSIYWYSWDMGSVHVVMLDSEHNMTKGSPQWTWVAADLAAVDRSVTPHVVVTQHRPLFTTEAGSQYDVAELMRADFEPLFHAHGVVAVLGGHIHSYERACPLVGPAAAYKCEEGGPAEGITYITVGTAGATVHNETMLPGTAGILKAWRVEWGLGILTAVNRSALRWDFWSIAEAKVVDSAWLRLL